MRGKTDKKSGKIYIREVYRMRATKATQRRNFVVNPEVVLVLFCFILSLLHQRKTRAHSGGESWLQETHVIL
jgi:hypothetical protein